MEIKFLITLTLISFVLFLILWYRTFSSFKFWTYFPQLWQQSKNKMTLQEHHKTATEKGLKPFKFEGGKKVIYSKNYLRAVLKYRKLR
jgi:hypothetical protein